MSSLLFLGFSVIAFIITYGIMFMLAPIIIGSFFSIDVDMSDSWKDTKNQTQEVIQWLIPLIPTIGIMILILKVLMVASVRGRD
jgi:membrane-anchored glycerophosphoryl diester phosphodiesterase (GDPDase)